MRQHTFVIYARQPSRLTQIKTSARPGARSLQVLKEAASFPQFRGEGSEREAETRALFFAVDPLAALVALLRLD